MPKFGLSSQKKEALFAALSPRQEKAHEDVLVAIDSSDFYCNSVKIAVLTTDNREQLKDYSNPQPHFGTAPEALLQGFSLLPEAEVHVVSCTRRPMSSPEKLAPNVFYHSVLVPKIGWMSTGYQGTIRAVRKKLREIRPDIVHGQGTERDCAMSAAFSGFPRVLTIHGNMRLIAKINKARPFSYMWLNAHLERFVLPRFQSVVCITRYTEEAVRGLVAQTRLLPNAVDARFFEVKRVPTAEVPEVLVVGLVCPRKNQNAFIDALDKLALERQFRLVFLGGVPKNDPYGAAFFERLKVRPWCEWAGFAGRDALRERLARATALALPSLEDNCPMVILEAMAAGVPVMAANVGGVPDLVTHGRTGLLFNPKEPSEMRQALLRLLDFPREAEDMAKSAKEIAWKRFHPREIASRHLEIYRDVLSNPQ